MPFRDIAITGGLGFIGSVIAEQFLAQGARVTVVDSLESNVVDPHDFSCRFPQASIEVIPCESYFSRKNAAAEFDLVVHTASRVGPAAILTHAGRLASEAVQSTAVVLEACARAGATLIYLSSAEVYGFSGVMSEADDLRLSAKYNARIEYALGKLTSEAMILNARAGSTSRLVIRPFNVAGARQSRCGGFVIPTFVQQALAGLPLTVFGTGGQQRAFTAVQDVAAFITNYSKAALESGHRIFNVGNPGNATTILDLAHRVTRLLCSHSEIKHTDGKKIYGSAYFEADSFVKIPAIGLAQRTGWNPSFTLDDIILSAAEYYCAHRDTRGADARQLAV